MLLSIKHLCVESRLRFSKMKYLLNSMRKMSISEGSHISLIWVCGAKGVFTEVLLEVYFLPKMAKPVAFLILFDNLFQTHC